MKFWFPRQFIVTAAIVVAVPATAGDKPLYEPAPEWVVARTADLSAKKPGTPLLWMDQQARIEKGRLWTYTEIALALDTPDSLTQLGTLQAQWLPDKGDLIVHDVQLIRGDQSINLLAGGSTFEVLRREQALEQRILSGILTATMPVSGARLGDVVLLRYSVTHSEQAMGDHVQWQAGLFAKPFPLGAGRVAVSWPADMRVSHATAGTKSMPAPALAGAMMRWETTLPLAEREPMPGDAPVRFQLNPFIQASTYPDWQTVSRSMAQHYRVDGAIARGSPLAEVVDRIASTSSDPLTRAERALRLVQDDVGYLLNGLSGGNYLPQSPAETWEKRFGDCKAKSILLLAILRELGIAADVVLVASAGGDSLPDLAPMPGNFDHMIVQAEIGGKQYWLDGTVAGTRLDTIDLVPPFFYVLPLTEAGSDLVRLPERVPTTFLQTVNLKIDQRAGIRVPAIFDIAINFRGSAGATWRAVAGMKEQELQENAINAAIAEFMGDTQVVSRSIEYDEPTGVATITGRGILTTGWKRDRAGFQFTPPAQAARKVSFDADRARAAWREIPLRLDGPNSHASNFELLLPADERYVVEGSLTTSQVVGEVGLKSDAALSENRFRLDQSLATGASELAPDRISTAKGDLARYLRTLPTLRSDGDVRQRWQYVGKDKQRLNELRAIYDRLVEDAKPDENLALINRASFLAGVYDFAGALADIERALAIESSAELHQTRYALHYQTGAYDLALADLRTIESQRADGETYVQQIDILGVLGRGEEARALAEDYRGLAKNRLLEDRAMASAMAWSGDAAGGLEVLKGLLRSRPGDGLLLNEICWHSGVWNLVTEETLRGCTEAVEKSDYSIAVLDSRAMAYYRARDFDKALADLNSVIELEPGLPESRLMRAAVKKAAGMDGWRDDLDFALRLSPGVAARYAAWGIAF